MAKKHTITDDGNWNWSCDQKDRKYEIQVRHCPSAEEMCHWAVDNGLIGLSDLSVATRNKFESTSGKHVMNWSEFQIKALAESVRDPLAAVKGKITNGKISDEEAAELMALLKARAEG